MKIYNKFKWSLIKEDDSFSVINLTKLFGLYQILNPNTTKIFGYNMYHIIIVLIGLLLFAVSMLSPIGLYNLSSNMTEFSFPFGFIYNMLFSCYKMMIILYYSKDVWHNIVVTRFNFMSYQYYNIQLFKNWQKRAIRIICIFIIISILALSIWIAIPSVFNTTTVTMKNLDGSYSEYRMNIFNLYLIVSNKTYNEFFYIFYIVEISVCVGYYYFTILFDILTAVFCCSLSGHLETISDKIKSLAYKSSKDHSSM